MVYDALKRSRLGTRNSKVDSEVVGHRTKVVSRQTPRRMEDVCHNHETRHYIRFLELISEITPQILNSAYFDLFLGLPH